MTEPHIEKWLPVPNYEDYEVSSWGVVASLKYRKRRILKAQWNGSYWHVTLSKNNKLKTFNIHILVSLAFLGPKPSPGLHCCHRDGDVGNNAAWNLYYGTPSQNAMDTNRHGYRNPPRGSINGMSKLTEKSVSEIRDRVAREAPMGPHGKRTNVHAAALIRIAKEYDMSARQIRDIVRGKAWHYEDSHP